MHTSTRFEIFQFDKEYYAKVADAVDVSQSIARLLLLDKAMTFEAFRYRMAILNAFFQNGESWTHAINLCAAQ